MQVSDKGQRSLGHGSEGSWVSMVRGYCSAMSWQDGHVLMVWWC